MAGNRSKNNPRDGLEGQWIWPGNLDSCDEHEQAADALPTTREKKGVRRHAVVDADDDADVMPRTR